MQVNKAQSTNRFPPGAVPVGAVSAIGSNGVVTATMPAVAGKTNYVSSVAYSGLGATAAAQSSIVLSGILGGTYNRWFTVPAGVAVAIDDDVMTFDPPIPASAVNTAIVATLGAFGAGNVATQCAIYGYVL